MNEVLELFLGEQQPGTETSQSLVTAVTLPGKKAGTLHISTWQMHKM